MRFKLSFLASIIIMSTSAQAKDVYWKAISNDLDGTDWATTSAWQDGQLPSANDRAILANKDLTITRVINISQPGGLPAEIDVNGTTFLNINKDIHFQDQTINVLGTKSVRPGVYLSQLNFNDNASAGNSTLNIIGQNIMPREFSDTGLVFKDNAKADHAIITVSDEALVSFFHDSSAENATITLNKGGIAYFTKTANIASATVTVNQGGVIAFDEERLVDGSHAKITNNPGGVVDISNNNAPVALGQLTGGGDIYLGGEALRVGALNQDATISGNISDGGAEQVNQWYKTTDTKINEFQSKGKLFKQGSGVLTLSGNNTYTGRTTINGGTIAIDNDSRLGAGNGDLLLAGGALHTTDDVTLNRILRVNGTGNGLHADNTLTLPQAVTGEGTVSLGGPGIVNVTGQNPAFTGTVNLDSGQLNVPGSIAAAVAAASGTVLSGDGQVGTTTLASGSTLQVGDGLIDQTSAPAGHFTVDGDLHNAGTVKMIRNANVTGSTLTVNGNYAGQSGSQLNFNTVLGDDSSSTDKMAIKGGSSGESAVAVTNVGGKGAQTVEGIELISVAGSSDANFTQSGRIVAGAYDYSLVRGQGDNAKNWYLTSKQPETKPTDTTDTTQPKPPVVTIHPVTPTAPVTPGKPVDNTTPPTKIVVPPVVVVTPQVTPQVTPHHDDEPQAPSTLRPEAASYIANQAAANTLFVHQLNDREGGKTYIDPENGINAAPSLWLRQSGHHTRFNDASGQLNTTANSYVAQLGGAVAQGAFGSNDHWDVGVMGGYANQKSHSHASRSGYGSRGQIDGYSVGLYATWFENAATRRGSYVDSWVNYNWFSNKVSGDGVKSESYDSKGVTASVETGYAWPLSRSEHKAVFIQPKAQIIYMGVKADDVTESNGTRVQSTGQANIQTRLGARVYMDGHSQRDDHTQRTFQPFFEATWIHNTHDFGVRMDQVTDSQRGASNAAEAKVGIEATVSKRMNLWGGVAEQVGDHGYNDTMGQVGIMYRF